MTRPARWPRVTKRLSLPARSFLGCFAAFMLTAGAWIWITPPFGGTDEFDHAYRAVSVAEGDWVSSETVPKRGRGYLVPVPPDIAAAARPMCEDVKYPGRDNCRPVDMTESGNARIASAAATYNPGYYAVVGYPTKFLAGNDRLYAMRGISGALVALIFALVAAMLSSAGSSAWATAGIAIAATPVVTASASVVAPNALEIAAGLGVVMGAFIVCTCRKSAARRIAVPLLVSSSVLLSVLRSAGPLWLLLCGIAALAWCDRTTLATLWSRHRGPVVAGTATVATAVGAGVAWTLLNGTNLNGDGELAAPQASSFELMKALADIPLWAFQMIAAYPWRDVPAPIAVYAGWSALLVIMGVLGWWRGRSRVRISTALLVLFSFGASTILAALAYREVGSAWQGRYALPVAISVPVLCGVALDRSALRKSRALPVLMIAVSGALTLTAMLRVRAWELTRKGPPDTGWEAPPVAWLVIVVALAVGAQVWALRAASSGGSAS